MDREKVIKGLEAIREFFGFGLPSQSPTFEAYQNILTDALALLKEQEAVEPRRIDGKRNHFIKCGNCNYDLLTGYMFCPHCGKAVKWE